MKVSVLKCRYSPLIEEFWIPAEYVNVSPKLQYTGQYYMSYIEGTTQKESSNFEGFKRAETIKVASAGEKTNSTELSIEFQGVRTSHFAVHMIFKFFVEDYVNMEVTDYITLTVSRPNQIVSGRIEGRHLRITQANWYWCKIDLTAIFGMILTRRRLHFSRRQPPSNH